MELSAGGTLGRYRIEGMLGRGGMAVVYRAHDPLFGRIVAVKILAPHLSGQPQYIERFQREARAMARLQHPNILPVYDVGEQDGVAYLVMQCIDGGSLHDRLALQRRAGYVHVAEMLAVLEPVADALDYAHGRGVIHRDIKPHNILLTAGTYPYLTDFGLAKVVDPDGPGSALTLANPLIGTPAYMSPEQAQGQPLDGRSDLYALGVIIYELFTGRVPFLRESATDTPLAVLLRHAGTPPPAPRALNPAITPALEAVLLQALAKRPDDRFASGAALFAAVGEALGTPERRASRFDLDAAAPTEVVSSAQAPPPSDESPSTAIPPRLAGAPAPHRRVLLKSATGAVAIALAALVFLLARVVLGGAESATPTGTAALAVPVGTAPTRAVTALATGTAIPEAPTVMAMPITPPAGAIASPLAATSTGAAERGAATPVARRPVILFSSHRNDVHDSQIYVMNPDGSGQRQLTFTRGHSWGPRLSPDGRFFVFSSVVPGEHVDHSATGGGRVGQGHHEIYRANADGSGIVRLTNTNAWNNVWAWSPDGRSVIIASDRDGGWELYRLSVEGEQGGILRLTVNPAQDGWPSSTPDGKHIVFASDREGGLSQIYIMDADGQNVRRLRYSASYDTLPSVSPDGRRIAFAAQSGSAQTGITSEIYAIDIDGANVTRLTSTVASNTDPSWSPDGSQLLFSSDRAGITNIYLMNADGSGVKRLTSDQGEDVTPFWGELPLAAAGPPAATPGMPGWPTDGGGMLSTVDLPGGRRSGRVHATRCRASRVRLPRWPG